MKNIAVEQTENGTFVVKADTERFGKQQIMFESYNRTECVRYILKTEVAIFWATGEEAPLAEIVNWMGEDKMAKLKAACGRNAYLTSYYGLEHIRTYKSENGGLYIKMEGCRSSFALYVDGNGIIRKAPPIKTMRRGHTYHGTNVFRFMG